MLLKLLSGGLPMGLPDKLMCDLAAAAVQTPRMPRNHATYMDSRNLIEQGADAMRRRTWLRSSEGAAGQA